MTVVLRDVKKIVLFFRIVYNNIRYLRAASAYIISKYMCSILYTLYTNGRYIVYYIGIYEYFFLRLLSPRHGDRWCDPSGKAGNQGVREDDQLLERSRKSGGRCGLIASSTHARARIEDITATTTTTTTTTIDGSSEHIILLLYSNTHTHTHDYTAYSIYSLHRGHTHTRQLARAGQMV